MMARLGKGILWLVGIVLIGAALWVFVCAVIGFATKEGSKQLQGAQITIPGINFGQWGGGGTPSSIHALEEADRAREEKQKAERLELDRIAEANALRQAEAAKWASRSGVGQAWDAIEVKVYSAALGYSVTAGGHVWIVDANNSAIVDEDVADGNMIRKRGVAPLMKYKVIVERNGVQQSEEFLHPGGSRIVIFKYP